MATTLTTKLATFAAVFLLLLISPSTADKDLIVNSCKKTPDSNLCVSTLIAGGGLKAADVKTLALILIDAVRVKGTAANDEVNKLKAATGQNPSKALNLCGECYNNVIHSLYDEAVKSLSHGVVELAKEAMYFANGEPHVCETAFETFGEGKCPARLSQLNSAAQEIAGVAEAMVVLLL
ncbi:Cell wall / vacuolar inhibitor of fructosidase 1 [Linum perenne]